MDERMRRRLLNLATAISLTFFVATVALSISTMSGNAVSARRTHLGPLDMRFAGGQTEFSWMFWIMPSLNAAPTLAEMCPRHALGFGLGADLFGNPRVVIPHWFIAVISMLLPAWWLLRRHRAKRAARMGVCPSCGYDLRATPERCPECGTAAALPAAR
jgi:hypothetical protein